MITKYYEITRDVFSRTRTIYSVDQMEDSVLCTLKVTQIRKYIMGAGGNNSRSVIKTTTMRTIFNLYRAMFVIC